MAEEKTVKTLFGEFKRAGKVKSCDLKEQNSAATSSTHGNVKRHVDQVEQIVLSSDDDETPNGFLIPKENRIVLNNNKEEDDIVVTQEIKKQKLGRNNISSTSANTHKSILTLDADPKKESYSSASSANELLEHIKQVAMQDIVLGEDQKKILDLVVNRNRSVFFTGAAGTGKSVLLRAIINELQAKYHGNDDALAVTATTGLAALNIGGKTYHSHFGLGLGDASDSVLIKRISRRRESVNAWRKCEVLIVDEVSLLDSRMLVKLYTIAQHFKKNTLPFGGIQLVLVGDFFQLPPIVGSYSKMLETKQVRDFDDYNNLRKNVYAFKSEVWTKCLHHQIALTKVYRQISDPDFVRYLNEVREGLVSDEADAAFTSLSRDLQKIDGVEPTQLYPTKKEANLFNLNKSNQLRGASILYKCHEKGSLLGTKTFESISNSFLAPNNITLKVGSQVMLIKNYTKDLVNGSLGVVVDFIDYENLNLLVENNRCKGGVFGHLEKEQGFDRLSLMQNQLIENEIDLESVKSYLFGLQVRENDAVPLVLPVVRFIGKSENSSKLRVVFPHSFDFLDHKTEEVLVSKRQLPLILAWALSVHKSQGQTYSLLKVDVSRTFEVGQVYVALSRVTSRKGLQIIGWNKRKVLTNSSVKDFYKKVQSVDSIDVDISERAADEHMLPSLLKRSKKNEIVGEYISLEMLSDLMSDSS